MPPAQRGFIRRTAIATGRLYGVYVVESMIRDLRTSRRANINIEGAVTWAFMFDQQPYFDGFRDLATNGIDKAVLNGFRMLGKLSGDWLANAKAIFAATSRTS